MSDQIDSFLFAIPARKALWLWPFLESYTSSPLELRLELQLDIGSDHGYLDYDIHEFKSSSDHHTKDCLTDRNSITTGYLQKDCFTSGYLWAVIYLDYMWDYLGLRLGNISLLDTYWLYWTLADKYWIIILCNLICNIFVSFYYIF